MGAVKNTNGNQRLNQRPLSPFLPVAFNLLMTSGMSIMHRITGLALVFGIFYLLLWLLATVAGKEYYDMFMSFSASPVGLFMLFGWSFCLYYHLANGIRHLIWDCGFLFNLKNAYIAGAFVMMFTAFMTLGTWGYVFYKFGNILLGGESGA